MKQYAYADEQGLVVHVIDEDGLSRSSMLASAVPEGATILRYVPDVIPEYDEFFEYITYPGKAFVNGDYVTIIEVNVKDIDLNEAKEEYRRRINAKRNELEVSGFMFMGKLIDSDERAVQRVSGASIAATAALAAGQPFGVDWTTADNTILTLDAAGVISMHMAMVTRVATLHAVATALKDAAMSCTTVQELRGIDIDTWPSV